MNTLKATGQLKSIREYQVQILYFSGRSKISFSGIESQAVQDAKKQIKNPLVQSARVIRPNGQITWFKQKTIKDATASV